MRIAKVYMHNKLAGYLTEVEKNKKYKFSYDDNFKGDPVSLTIQLDGLLRIKKIDKDDYFSQLMATGADLVGAVSVEESYE